MDFHATTALSVSNIVLIFGSTLNWQMCLIKPFTLRKKANFLPFVRPFRTSVFLWRKAVPLTYPPTLPRTYRYPLSYPRPCPTLRGMLALPLFVHTHTRSLCSLYARTHSLCSPLHTHAHTTSDCLYTNVRTHTHTHTHPTYFVWQTDRQTHKQLSLLI